MRQGGDGQNTNVAQTKNKWGTYLKVHGLQWVSTSSRVVGGLGRGELDV